MKFIPLYKSEKFAIVDDEDFQRLNSNKWYISGSNDGVLYRHEYSNSKAIHISMPAEIMHKPGVLFDHIDRNPYNNQKHNLREATKSLNAMNRKKVNNPNLTSKYKGVSKCGNMWRAILGGRKQKHLGTFFTQEEAATTYDNCVSKKFGEFAVTNFPVEKQTTNN